MNKPRVLLLILVLTSISLTSAALTDGIISYWKFDGNLTDSAGSNDGNDGGTSNTTGKINEARSFDGTNNFINFTTGINPTTAVTFNAWVWHDDTADDFIGGKWLWDTPDANGRAFALSSSSGKLKFFISSDGSDAGTGSSTSSGNIGSGAWVMVTGAFDGTTIKTYINGAPDGSTLKSSGISAESGTPFFLGVQNGGAATQYSFWDGKIDEVGIWNRALSEAEILSLYNSGDGFSYPFLTAGYNLTIAYVSPPTPVNYYNITGTANFTIEVNVTLDNVTLTNITYSLRNVNGTDYNTTFTNSTYSYNYTNIPEGHYHYDVTVCGIESIGNTTVCEATSVRHINHDVTPPTITISSPSSNYEFLYPEQTLDLNITAIDEVNNISSCFYDYNGTNYSISCTNGTLASTQIIQEAGNYNITVYANDTFGNLGSATKTWTFDVFQNSINYSSTTSETSQENFTLNLTLGSGISLSSAYLNYNGTQYSTSISSSGSIRIITSSIQIPQTNSTFNASFFWELTTSSGAINTSSNIQTVNTLKIDDCSVNTNLILNYTIFDEDSRTIMSLGQNITANFYVQLSGDLTGEIYNYFSGTINNNTILICVDNALLSGENYRLDALVQYTADDYVQEYNYIENSLLNISVIPKNISLYLLASNNSQEFLVTYKDSNLLPVEGAIIEITRQYPELGPGAFLSVENMKTDSDGRSIGHFVLSEEIYTLYVTVDGVLKATYENQRAFCNNLAIGDCTINLNEKSSTSNPSSYKNYLGIASSQSYDKTTRELSFDFTSTDGSAKTINVTLYRVNGTIIQETICSEEVTSSAGTLTCTIPSQYYNETALVRILVDGTTYNEYYLSIAKGAGQEANSEKYIMAFFLIITLPLIAFTSGPMVLVMFLLGFVVAVGLAIISLGGFIGPLSAFLWFVVAAVILLIKSSSKKQQI